MTETDKVSTAPGWSDETLKKVGASLDDGHYNLGMCRSTYAALCCERERNVALSSEVERLKVALAGEVLARAHDMSTGVATFSCYLCETLDTIGADGSGHKDGCLVSGMAFDAALGE